VAKEGGVYFAGCINQTAYLYSQGAGKDVVMKKFREQIEIFLQNNVDLIIAEVSYVKLHLNLESNLTTMEIYSSVLTSALKSAAIRMLFYSVFKDYNSFDLHYSRLNFFTCCSSFYLCTVCGLGLPVIIFLSP